MSKFLLVIVAALAVVSAKSASDKVQSLKATVTAKASKFQLHKNDVFAKYSKIGQKVVLTEKQQRTAWANAKSSNFDAFAGTEDGIMLSKNGNKVLCKADNGKELSNAYVAHFNCDAMRFRAMAHPDTPTGSQRTHPTLHDEKNQPHVHEGTYGGDPDFNTRIRFWHRCANGPYNGLSLCKRYKFTAVDSEGYYGCSQLTANGYCVESFRHEWMEFNPNDLPFTINPPNPCLHADCDNN
jgi:opacity protein-like surface antigen